MGLLDRLGSRREPEPLMAPAIDADEPQYPTKALRKLLSSLTNRQSPSLMDLGPVVGSNLTFFGEELGCKMFIEDTYAELERHAKAGTMEQLPGYLSRRFTQPDSSVDGILCWDLIEYLDKASAKELADQLTRILRPEGSLLAFFSTVQPRDVSYTKFIIADDTHLKHRPYPASRGRQAVLANRDIIQLFSGLRVSDSFLMKNNVREILFRKPAYDTR